MVAAREEGGDEVVVAAEPRHRLVLPPRDGGWSMDDLADADESLRFEIVDGTVEVSPPVRWIHRTIQAELIMILGAAKPAGWLVTVETGIAWPDNERVPDVTVLRVRPDADRRTVLPGEVALAVEIESPSSLTTDRVTKPAQYAELGIPAYWRVESEPEIVVHAYELRDGRYVETATGVAGDALSLAVPFPVSIEIKKLGG